MESPKKRMILTVVLLSVIIIAAAISCFFAVSWMSGGKDETQGAGMLSAEMSDTQLSTDEIVRQVITRMDYKDLSKTEKDQISKHYVIPDGLVKDVTMYLSKSPDSAFEISCFQIADKNYQPQLDKVVADHIATKQTGFKDSPKEYELLQNYTMVHDGDYTLVVVEENGEAAANIFKSILKE